MKRTLKIIKIPLVSQEGEVKEGRSVSAEIFGVEKSPFLLAQAVRGFLANQRQAQARTKTRAEVVGSGAKIWRQKGTGRARHGDRQAPIFVGGGVAHGPTGGQNYQEKLNRKMARQAIWAVLSEKLKGKKVFLVEDFGFKKTKEAFGFCQKVRDKLGVKGKMAFLFGGGEEQERFFCNLKDTLILKTQSLSPYFFLQSEVLFLTGKALTELEERTGKEKNENET